MICCVCKKKEAKFVMPKVLSTQSGFCSRVCIANKTIKHYKITKIKVIK